MVAPVLVGEPVRSLVRVPTKSRTTTNLCWDISRSSSLAAAAAPLHQPLQARLVLAPDPATQSPKPPQPLAGQHTPSPGPLPLAGQQQAASPGPPPPAGREVPPHQQTCEPKRPREEEEEQDGAEGSPRPVLKMARTAGPTEAVPPSTPPQAAPISSSPGPGPSSPAPGPSPPQSWQGLQEEVQCLRQLCQFLQQENEALQQRVAGPGPPESQQDLVQQLQQTCHSLGQQNEELQRRLSLFHGLFRDKQRLASFVKHLDTVVG